MGGGLFLHAFQRIKINPCLTGPGVGCYIPKEVKKALMGHDEPEG
jgi:hypothetical protein